MSRGNRREDIFFDDAERPKSGADKLEIAARLRKETTTLTIKAIASLAHLGTSKSANANLHRHMRQGVKVGAGKRRKRK